jgi:sterol desaturase/sphingolipid hydroxylase (fatty acid hydroxylase superfamily)
MPSDAHPLGLPLSLTVWAIQMVVYHGVALAFEALDRTGRLSCYRVRPPDRLSYRTVMPLVLVNQCLVLLPSMMALEAAGLAYTGAGHLQPLHFILGLAVMAIGHDVVQYLGHRPQHMFRRLQFLGHGIHHGTTASRAVSACYMHPADFVFQIVLPYLVPLVVIGGGGRDILFHVMTVGLGAIGGLYEHSGYDFAAVFRGRWKSRPGAAVSRAAAFMVSSHAHAEHHRRSDVSFSDGFGSPGLCDTLMGTRWDLAVRRKPHTRS